MLKNRTGETHRAKNGLMMTIISYRRSDDIDVMFEDGYIAHNRTYDMFVKGSIGNPNVSRAYWKRNREVKSFRIGETNRAKNGLIMTLVVYRRCDDIDVLFEDGYLAEHKQYVSFLTGEILNPNAVVKGPDIKSDRVGEVRTNKQGLKMTLIAYRKSEDVDIQFENGAIVQHVQYYSFNKGTLQCPGVPRHAFHLGETREMSNGQMATIIEYRNARDIDIRFDDGTVAMHKEYAHFKRGSIKNPNYNAMDKYLGQTQISTYGFSMKIIACRSSKDADVLFDTGYVKNRISLQQFKLGQIGHPFPYQIGSISMNAPAYVCNQIGNFYCHCSKCGLQDIMTIKEMRDHKCSKTEQVKLVVQKTA